MTDYFCKNGGDGLSATTNPGTSGDWSGAFPDFATATGTAGRNDRLFVSDDHDITYFSSQTLSLAAGAGKLIVKSVADLDTSVYSAGAIERTNGSFDTYRINGGFAFYGVNFDIGGAFFSTTGTVFDDNFYMEDATFSVSRVNAGQRFNLYGPGDYTFLNCVFYQAQTSTTELFYHASNGSLYILRGRVDANNNNAGIFYRTDSNNTLVLKDFDFGNVSVLMDDDIATGSNNASIEAYRCKVPAGFMLNAQSSAKDNLSFNVVSYDSGDNFWRRQSIYGGRGQFFTDTGTYRDGSQEFPGGIKASLYFDPGSHCGTGTVLRALNVGGVYDSGLSTMATVHIASNSVITDDDMDIVVNYADSNALAYALSASFRLDPTGTGTELPAGAVWTNAANTYQCVLSLPGLGAGLVAFDIYATTTKNFWVDFTIELS